MTRREDITQAVSTYLTDHFPHADIAVKIDGLTASTVFTIIEDGVARHVEIPKRVLEDAGVSLPNAIREQRLAEQIRGLPPNGIVRIGVDGLEKVS